MTKVGRLLAMGGLMVLGAGCGGGKFEVKAEAKVEERKLKSNDPEKADLVDVSASPKDYGKVRVSRVEIIGKEALDTGYLRSTYAAESFPVGTTRVKLKVKGETKNLVRKWSAAETIVEVDVTRPPLGPRAYVGPGTSASGCFGSRVCVFPPNLDLATGKVDFGINAPVGTKVEIQGRPFVGKGMTQSVPASFDMSKEVGSTPIDGRIPIAIKLTSPDGVSEVKSATIDLNAGRIRTALDGVKKGPVRFAGDSATVGPARLVAYKKGTTTTFYGKGLLTELELVAFVESLPTRNMSCGTYVGQTTGRRVTISNSAYDEEVVVYERKTGRVRTRRTFRAAMPGCSSSTSSASGSGGFVNSKDLTAYVESLVAR